MSRASTTAAKHNGESPTTGIGRPPRRKHKGRPPVSFSWHWMPSPLTAAFLLVWLTLAHVANIEPPRSQSHIQMADHGVDLLLRYPARPQHGVCTADEIARRLIDAINREPGLTVVALGTPTVQHGEDALMTTPLPLDASSAKDGGSDGIVPIRVKIGGKV